MTFGLLGLGELQVNGFLPLLAWESYKSTVFLPLWVRRALRQRRLVFWKRKGLRVVDFSANKNSE